MGAVIASATMFVSVLATSTEPDAVRTPDPDTVSPGFAGFLAVFAIAVVTVLLIRSMTKHMRKVKFLAEERDRLELESLEERVAPKATSAETGTGTQAEVPGQR